MKILIGSNNAHKAREIRTMMPEHEIFTPKEIGLEIDPDETGTTFAENAMLKARSFAAHTDMTVLADDSGLQVEALNNEPGIYSARYCPKPDATDADRRAYLLEKLKSSSAERPWKARFCCTVALVFPDGSSEIVEGFSYGEIIPEERGDDGFGYDPLFYVPEFGRTYAELSGEEKNKISHRGNAIKAVREVLNKR